MKAEEYRIGNILNYYIGSSVKQGIITGLSTNKIVIDHNTSFNLTSEFDKRRIIQIELTEEWLLKFKFKNVGIWEEFMPYYVKDGVLLFFNEHRTEYELSDYLSGYGEMRQGKYYCTTFKWINSVHQLQNLYFALTGEELTIK